jgi:hypothetical protein
VVKIEPGPTMDGALRTSKISSNVHENTVQFGYLNTLRSSLLNRKERKGALYDTYTLPKPTIGRKVSI